MAPVTSSGPNSTLSSDDSESNEETRPECPEKYPQNREPTPLRLEDQIDSLRKFTRSQVISSIAQLEEKKYVECSNKGCRFIALSVGEMAMHLPRCQGSRGNDKLLMCKYCPHGTTSHDAMTNHTILSHPYASEVLSKSVKGMKFVENEPEKELFRSSHEARRIFKSHWRTCLETKGYILCLNPLCHHVTCLIPEMEDHFLKCKPAIWGLLKFSCEKCCGRTFSEKQLTAHYDECHPSTQNIHYLPYMCADQNTIAFWERCLKAYGVSKCLSENCQFVAYSINELKKHYRYCRVPHAENYEVCRNCGAWFESLEGLGEHKQRFGKNSKLYSCRTIMDILRNLRVDSSDFPFLELQNPGILWSPEPELSCNTTQKKLTTNIALPNIPIKVEELMETPNSFLQELGRAIENECGDVDSYQKIELSINDNERSWKVEVTAPCTDKAAQVVNRKMPSYSLKRIVAGSLENSLNLLKRSSVVTRVENIASRPYVPPKPMDFVLDELDTLSALREKFGVSISKDPEPPITPLEPSPSPAFTLEGDSDQDPKRTKKKNSSGRMRRASANAPALDDEDLISADNPRPLAKKSKKVRDFLPELVVQKPSILRRYGKKPSKAETAASPAKSLGAVNSQVPVSATPVPTTVTIKPGTDNYNKIQAILASWKVPPGTPVIVKEKGPDGMPVTVSILSLTEWQKSSLQKCQLKSAFPTQPSRRPAHPQVPELYQTPKQASSQVCRIEMNVPNLAESGDSQPETRVYKRPESLNNSIQRGVNVYGRSQSYLNVSKAAQQEAQWRESLPNCSVEANIQSSIPSAPSTASNPALSLLGKRVRQASMFEDSCVESDSFEPSDEPPCKMRVYSSKATLSSKAHPTAFSNYDLYNSNDVSDVTLLDPRGESPIPFKLPTLMSGGQVICGETTSISDYYEEGTFRPNTPNVRTYLRKATSSWLQDGYKSVVPKLERLSPLPDEGIFAEDPLDDTSLCKTEPIDHADDDRDIESSCDFHELYSGSYDFICDSVDNEVPLPDVFLDTGSFVRGGLFNDRSPWELPSKPTRKTRKNNPVVPVNPYRGSKLRENGQIQNQIDDSENRDVLNDSAYRCSLKGDPEKLDQFNDEKRLKDLAKYLTDVDRRTYKNEPLIYMVNKTYTYSALAKMRTGRTSSNAEPVSVPESDKAGNSRGNEESSKVTKAEEEGSSRGKRKRKSEPKQVKTEDESVMEEDESHISKTPEVSRSSRGRRKRKVEPSKVIVDGEEQGDASLSENGSKPVESVVSEVRNSPKKRNSRSKKSVGDLQPSSSNGLELPVAPDLNLNDSQDHDGSPLEADSSETAPDAQGEAAPRRRGRPKKKRRFKRNLEVTSFLEQGDPLADDPDDPTDPNFLYVDGDQYYESESLVPAIYRIQYNTVLTHPLRVVTCAVCDESMTASAYKRNHLDLHNHMCWLKGEEPMDLDDERTLERHLYNVYINTKIVFTCEKCQKGCKSAKGFLSHRRFCGKSIQEIQDMLVKCKVCSRMMKPSSLLSHMNTIHPQGPPTKQDSLSGTRSAATKCLSNISSVVQDLQNQEPFIDESEEKKAAEEHKWIRSAYTFSKRRVLRDTRSHFEAALEETGELKCLVPGCSHVGNNVNQMMDHYRSCDSEALDYKCISCNFVTSKEALIINHVRTVHQNKVEEFLGRKSIDMSDLSGTFIPFMKAGELQSRSLLYMQPALTWTNDLRRTFLASDQLYPDWVNFGPMKNLEDFPGSYFELKDESMQISFSTHQSQCSEWLTMRKLTSRKFDNDGVVLFTGGIVRSFDWFPCTSKQHLIISVGNMEAEGINLKTTHSVPGHFQIWSAGTLDNFSNNYDAELKFEFAVCHEFGEVWDVKCCPAGTTDGRRLGLVALATSSGKVPVYTIPLLETSSNRACKLVPVVVLELGLEESFQVTKISWSKTKPHRFIAAGFSNGLVGVWDLTTTSSLLKSDGCLIPFKLFHAHFTTITGLSFSPVNEYYLVTACSEKSTKYWHLEDTSVPQTEFTRGLAMDVEWIQHWMSTISAIDDTYTIGSTTACLNPIRNFVFANQPVITQADSCANTVSVNDWLNAYVCGYDSGQVLLTVAFKLRHSQDDRKRVHSLLIAPHFHEFDPGSKEIFDGKSYASTSEHFGIRFVHNFAVNSSSKIKPHPCKDLMHFPATATTKVCWNPNPHSFLTLATGFHSGFVILSRLKLPKNEANELLNITENLNLT